MPGIVQLTSLNCDEVIPRIAANDEEIKTILCVYLDLDTNKFREFFAALFLNNVIITINLEYSEIRDEETAIALAKVLDSSTTLTRLSLEFNNTGINSEVYTTIFNALARNTSITTLSLFYSVTDTELLRGLAKVLAKNTTLTRLNLKDSCRIDFEKARVIAQALRHNTSLTDLNLSRNSIEAAGATEIANALRHNTSLTDLNLSQNSIGAAGATEIANALGHNTTLTTLNLSQNSIGAAGATAIAEALTHNTTLKTIYLENNKIGAAGATEIAQALRHNTSLTDLNLSRNSIGAAGAVAIGNALTHNTTLKAIYLENNKIEDAGAVAIGNALRHNTSLTELWLSNNSIEDAGAVAIGNALRHNTSLTRLWLSLNSIGDAVAAEMANALRHNTSLVDLILSSADSRFHLFSKVIEEHLQNNRYEANLKALAIILTAPISQTEYRNLQNSALEELKKILLQDSGSRKTEFTELRLYSFLQETCVKMLVLTSGQLQTAPALYQPLSLKAAAFKVLLKNYFDNTDSQEALGKLKFAIELMFPGAVLKTAEDRRYEANLKALAIILTAPISQTEYRNLQNSALEELKKILLQDSGSRKTEFTEPEFCSFVQETRVKMLVLTSGQLQRAPDLYKPLSLKAAALQALLKNYFDNPKSVEALGELKFAIELIFPGSMPETAEDRRYEANLKALAIILTAPISPNHKECINLQSLVLEALNRILLQDSGIRKTEFTEPEFCSFVQEACANIQEQEKELAKIRQQEEAALQKAIVEESLARLTAEIRQQEEALANIQEQEKELAKVLQQEEAIVKESLAKLTANCESLQKPSTHLQISLIRLKEAAIRKQEELLANIQEQEKELAKIRQQQEAIVKESLAKLTANCESLQTLPTSGDNPLISLKTAALQALLKKYFDHPPRSDLQEALGELKFVINRLFPGSIPEANVEQAAEANIFVNSSEEAQRKSENAEESPFCRHGIVCDEAEREAKPKSSRNAEEKTRPSVTPAPVSSKQVRRFSTISRLK